MGRKLTNRFKWETKIKNEFIRALQSEKYDQVRALRFMSVIRKVAEHLGKHDFFNAHRCVDWPIIEEGLEKLEKSIAEFCINISATPLRDTEGNYVTPEQRYKE